MQETDTKETGNKEKSENSIIHQTAQRILTLVEEKKAGCQKDTFILAIDGRCASGKTTLASYLQDLTDCAVIHMDHFFLRPEQRTKERYDTPGGNVDYERFLEEVIKPLGQGSSFQYRSYDCGRGVLGEPIGIAHKALTLVEGSYSCHPALWESYDLRIFLTVDEQTQIDRILRRNGAEAADVFREKWIPLEEKYFAAYGIEARCDFCFRT